MFLFGITLMYVIKNAPFTLTVYGWSIFWKSIIKFIYYLAFPMKIDM